MAVKDGLPSTDFSRMNREYIKAVAEGGSGGGGLPEITEADEGKFLGVVSGEAAWATAGGGGGGGALMIGDTFVDDTIILNKTAAEIAAAATTGPVVYTWEDSGQVHIEYLTAVFYQPDTPHEYAYTFTFGESNNFYANAETDYPQNPGPALPD